MYLLRLIVLLTIAFGMAGCGSSKFKTYDGPEVTKIVVSKTGRMMYLLHHHKVLKSYPIDLGFAPAGHKQFEGDGRTPEGHYLIDRRNPNSSFHLSIGISYPNERDIAFARTMHRSPGGDIFIHGEPNNGRKNGQDWTAGCISVENDAIEDIYAMVRDGTPISIYP